MLGDKIKQIRLENGWTMEQMGAYLDAHKSSVYTWETGRNRPNRYRLQKIADLGGMTVPQLLDMENKVYLVVADNEEIFVFETKDKAKAFAETLDKKIIEKWVF